jgi:hypothetical protein
MVMRNVRKFDDRQKAASTFISAVFFIAGCTGGVLLVNLFLKNVSIQAHVAAGFILYPLFFLLCGFVAFVVSGFLCMLIDSFFNG